MDGACDADTTGRATASAQGEAEATLQVAACGDELGKRQPDRPCVGTRRFVGSVLIASPRPEEAPASKYLHHPSGMRDTCCMNRRLLSDESKKKLWRPCREARALER
jgi:hypothetical protein